MKKIYLSLLFILSLTYSSYAQWTTGTDISNTNSGSVGIGTTTPVSKLDVNGNGNYTGAVQIGNAQVNSNTTKLFIKNNYGGGKNWALSAGANSMTEEGFHIYNWTDNINIPLLSIANDGSTTVRSSLQIGNGKVNSNTTKLFINNNYGDGKNWALSAGANGITEQGFHLYNWTDYPDAPRFSIENTGSATFRNVTGGTLILMKSSTNIPGIIFQGATSSTVLEGGDDYFATTVGGSRRMTVFSNGTVGIGTNNPSGYMLAVNGSVHAKSVTVDIDNWPDFVFEKEYALPSLSALKAYVDQNHHLPEIPSKQEIADKGLELGEMNKLLIKKVEELTLYVIEQHKQIEILAEKDKLNQVQAEKIKEMEKRIDALSKR